MMVFVDHLTAGVSWRERAGDGPVLVALHGIGSEARCFDRLATFLPGWRLIAWNAPGYGNSTPLQMEWPVAADYATALERWVAAIKVSQFHLLGHSLGTLIAAAYAASCPKRIKSLTLAACAQGGGIPSGAALSPDHAARIDDLARNGAKAFAAARAPRLIHAPENNQQLVEEVTKSMARVSMPGYGQAVRMLAGGNLSGECTRLSVPTAVIVGARDIVTPPIQSAEAYAALPRPVQRDFVEVPDAGHAIHLQAPQNLASLLEAQARATTNQEKERT